MRAAIFFTLLAISVFLITPVQRQCFAEDQSPTALDISRGIKCTLMQTNMIYYFKGDKIRFETPARIPGIKTYDVQIGNEAYYRIVVASDGAHAGKIPVRQTFDQWYDKVVAGSQKLAGKPGAAMTGAPRCESTDLPDKLFEIPQ